METHQTGSLLRLEGDGSIASAAEWKGRLLEGLASGGDLRLDLTNLENMDTTLLQLLVAARREADHSGVRITARLSAVLLAEARDAGFEPFPVLEEAV